MLAARRVGHAASLSVLLVIRACAFRYSANPGLKALALRTALFFEYVFLHVFGVPKGCRKGCLEGPFGGCFVTFRVTF